MTQINKLSAILILLLSICTSALAADCVVPSAPIIPDGNVASEDELVSAQKAFKAYESKVYDYRDCLTEAEKAITVDAENAEVLKADLLALDNVSVDNLNKVANEFNAAVRAFKAR